MAPKMPPDMSPIGRPSLTGGDLLPVDAQRTGQRLRDDVEGGPVTERAVLPEAADGAVDQAWVLRHQRCSA